MNYAKLIFHRRLGLTSNIIFSGCTDVHRTAIRCMSNTPNVSEQNHPLGNFFLNLTQSYPVFKIEESLITVHNYTGLSWPCTVILTTVAIRTAILLPAYIHQSYVSTKLEIVDAELKRQDGDIWNKINEDTNKYEWTEEEALAEYCKVTKKMRNDLIERHNCHPLKIYMLTALNFPVWVGLSSALRNIVFMIPNDNPDVILTHMELSTSSFLWIDSLTMPNAVFPCMVAALNILNLEMSRVLRIGNNPMMKVVINIFRVLALTIVWFGLRLPSFITIYWITSTSYAVVQNILFASPRVRLFFGIPMSPSLRQHPYRRIINKIQGFIKIWRY